MSAIWSRAAIRKLRTLIGHERPDIIHVHNLFPLLSPAVLRVVAPPVVVTLHNYRMLCIPATFLREGRTCESCLGRSPIPGVLHRCYRGSVGGSAALAASLMLHRAGGTFHRPAMFIAVSEFVKAKHVQAGWDPGRITVKPNFAWPAVRRADAGGDFLYMGRLSVEKGLAGLIRAWPRARAKLVVVGDGPERTALEAIAPASVEFRGAVPAAEVGAYLTRARALLLPSVCYEGAPRTVVEAFAAGVPVIASRRGALPDIVQDGVSGLVVDHADADAWTGAVERLGDDRLSIALGAGAWRAWRANHSPAQSAAALEGIYASVTGLQPESKVQRHGAAAHDLTAGDTARISQGTR